MTSLLSRARDAVDDVMIFPFPHQSTGATMGIVQRRSASTRTGWNDYADVLELCVQPPSITAKICQRVCAVMLTKGPANPPRSVRITCLSSPKRSPPLAKLCRSGLSLRTATAIWR